MKWTIVEERVKHWYKLLGIDHAITLPENKLANISTQKELAKLGEGKIYFLKPKWFNKLNNPKLRKTDWGRCNHTTRTFTMAAYRISIKDIDITTTHEILHLLYPLRSEKWVDKRAELIAGYDWQDVVKAVRKRATSF